MTTNIVKCINGVLKEAWMLPITALVKLTFCRCVSYFETSRVKIRVSLLEWQLEICILRMQLINLEELKPKLVDIM